MHRTDWGIMSTRIQPLGLLISSVRYFAEWKILLFFVCLFFFLLFSSSCYRDGICEKDSMQSVDADRREMCRLMIHDMREVAGLWVTVPGVPYGWIYISSSVSDLFSFKIKSKSCLFFFSKLSIIMSNIISHKGHASQRTKAVITRDREVIMFPPGVLLVCVFICLSRCLSGRFNYEGPCHTNNILQEYSWGCLDVQRMWFALVHDVNSKKVVQILKLL